MSPPNTAEPADDNVRTGGYDVGGIVQLCTAVNLQLALIAILLDFRADSLDFVHALRDKALTAKARLNGHDEHHIAIRQQREQHLSGGFRLDNAGCLDTGCADFLQLLERITVGLVVYGDDIRAGLDEVVQILVRPRSSDVHRAPCRSPCAAP